MKTRKIITILLAAAVLLAFALPMTASAANVTITEGKATSTYDAYKLFGVTPNRTCTDPLVPETAHETHDAADCYTYAYVLNSKYKAAVIEVLEAAGIDTTGMTDARLNTTAATAIRDMGAPAFAKAVYAEIMAEGLSPDETKTSNSFTLAEGYWLIVETTADPLAEGDVISPFILDTVGEEDVRVTGKKDVPTPDKKVKEENGTFGNSADVNIGDTVYFEITGTLDKPHVDFSEYEYYLHDTMGAGLDYNSDMKIYVENAGVRSADILSQCDATSVTGKTILKFGFEDLKALSGVTINADSKIIFAYSAVLNANATVGSAGNSNTAKLEYSSDPRTVGRTNKTPGNEGKVYTFGFEVVKVNGDDGNLPLAGAIFNLFDAENNQIEFVLASGVYKVAKSGGDPDLTSAAVTGLITVKGLGAGVYTLREIATPGDFNLLTYDIMIKITHDGNGAYTVAYQHSGAGYNAAWTSGATLEVDPGEYQIVNSTGTQLPNTGGMGEALIILGGLAIIAVFAGAIVVYKKRRTLNAVRG